MASFLESQLSFLEQDAVLPNASEVEDLIAFHLTALERLEGHLEPTGLSEKDRPLVPLFRRWLAVARKVKETAQELRSAGNRVSGYDDLLRAMNRSKPIAESFDYFVALNGRLTNAPSSSANT